MKNRAHSIRDKLLHYSKREKQTFQFTLIRYGMERFLYRLSQSAHQDSFILKGGALFLAWTGKNYRVTKDIDLLGLIHSDKEKIKTIFIDLCLQNTYHIDGLVFYAEHIQISDIKENDKYKGLRVNLLAKLQSARIPIQIDIGFGDMVSPEALPTRYPCLLGGDIFLKKSYPIYTVVSEKLETMFSKGLANSRMKDFYDVWLLSREFVFDGTFLQQAIIRTFERRNSPMDVVYPFCFSPVFYEDLQKVKQWSAFIKNFKPDPIEKNFSILILDISKFLLPIWASILKGEDFHRSWEDNSWNG